MKSKRTDPWAALDALVKQDPEPVGDGWFTTEQFSKRYGIKRRASLDRLKALRDAGKLDFWQGTAAVTRRITTKWRPKQ